MKKLIALAIATATVASAQAAEPADSAATDTVKGFG